MKVRAIRLGYYNHRRRRENEVFELLDEKAFSNKWMVRIEKVSQKPVPEPPIANAPMGQASSEEVI